MRLLRQPNVSSALDHREDDLPGAERGAEPGAVLETPLGGGLVDDEGVSQRALGSAIQALGPEAPVTSSSGEEIEDVPVRGPEGAELCSLENGCKQEPGRILKGPART